MIDLGDQPRFLEVACPVAVAGYTPATATFLCVILGNEGECFQLEAGSFGV